MTSPEVVADTATLLTASTEEIKGVSSRFECCRRPRRRSSWFFIELMLIAFCFNESPMMLVTQKYTLNWITINVFNASSRGSWPPASIPSPCDPNITDFERHLSDKVQSMTSLFAVVESVVFGVPALIMTIILGAGSDRFGRRFSMLPPLLGVFLNSVVAYSIIRTDSSIVFFFIGDFLYGCCGSISAMAMSCFAYVADRTPADRRVLRITLLTFFTLLARITSFVGIGPVAGLIGIENVVLVIVFISAINFAYVFLFLRDDDHKLDEVRVTVGDQLGVPGRSYTDDEGRSSLLDAANSHVQPASDADATGCTTGSEDHQHLPRFRHIDTRSDDNPIDISHSLNRNSPEPRSELAESRVERQIRTLCNDVQRLVSLFLSPRRSRVRLNILMAAFFISTLPTFDMPLLNLFEMNHPLCWTVREIGQFTGIFLAISALGALVVTPVMKKCANDWHIAVTSSVAAFITEVYRFFVRDSVMMYLSSSLSMFVVLLIPSIRSLMSALVSDHEQGAVFGAIASVEVLCVMLGALTFNTIYSKTLDVASGFVFLVMAAFYAVACVLLLGYYVRSKLELRQQQRHHDATSTDST